MAVVRVSNRNVAKKIKSISAGDIVELEAGNYYEPLVLSGVVGTEERPVIIRSNDLDNRAVFKSDLSDSTAQKRANRVAAHREKSGYYPTVAHLGEQALLILQNCQFVVIDAVNFDGCWPAGVFIDNSMYVGVNACHFRKGTVAIVAQGANCHDVVIQHCCWQQDTSRSHSMWNTVLWDRIHGASNNGDLGGVDIEKDYRHWDGDFFRAWNVHGNFTFSNNRIEDAFNAIHFFNSRDRLAPGVVANNLKFNQGRQSSVNVLIENNEFIRIRDNVFEPEDHAWNWVIRHNRLVDCYRPFSFEFERAGWFYVYGNTGAFLNRPTDGAVKPHDEKVLKDKRRRTPSLFKCKGTQANEGPIYVFNNSWYYVRGKGLFSKHHLGRLVHQNNATQFEAPGKDQYFGKGADKASVLPFDLKQEVEDEERRFTRRWKTYYIQMDGDVCNDKLYPEKYRALGYALGGSAKGCSPEFKGFGKNGKDAFDFTAANTALHKTSVALNLQMPDGTEATVNAGYNIGAVQDDGAYDAVDCLFGFLPLNDWLNKAVK